MTSKTSELMTRAPGYPTMSQSLMRWNEVAQLWKEWTKSLQLRVIGMVWQKVEVVVVVERSMWKTK